MPNRYASDFKTPTEIQDWLMRYGIFINRGQAAGWIQDAQDKVCNWKIRVWRRNGGNWRLYTEKRNIR